MTREITAEKFDAKFDAGEDVSEYVDWDSAVTSHSTEEFEQNMRNFERRDVSVSLPGWLVDVLDAEAERRATSRRAVINDWLVERADAEAAAK